MQPNTGYVPSLKNLQMKLNNWIQIIASFAPDLAIHHFRNIHDTDSGFIHSVQYIYPSKQQGKPALVKNYNLRIRGAYVYFNIKLIIDHRILLEILTISEPHWQECWILPSLQKLSWGGPTNSQNSHSAFLESESESAFLGFPTMPGHMWLLTTLSGGSDTKSWWLYLIIF